MNGEDMLRALEAKRDEIDTAIRHLRAILRLVPGPAIPEELQQSRRIMGQHRPRKRREPSPVPPDTAAQIVAYLASQDAPVAAGDILSAVPRAQHWHLYQLKKDGRLRTTGITNSTRYRLPPAKTNGTPAGAEVVWSGGVGLSSYQQQVRG